MALSRLSTTIKEDLSTTNNEYRTWENTSETPELTLERSNVMLTEDVEGDTRHGTLWTPMVIK